MGCVHDIVFGVRVRCAVLGPLLPGRGFGCVWSVWFCGGDSGGETPG